MKGDDTEQVIGRYPEQFPDLAEGPDPLGLFRGAGIITSRAGWIPLAGNRVQDFFNPDPELPINIEIIFIPELEVPQKDVLRIIGETHATSISDAIILAMYDKTMEM